MTSVRIPTVCGRAQFQPGALLGLGIYLAPKCDDVVCVGGVPGTAEENPCLDLTGALCVLVTQS